MLVLPFVVFLFMIVLFFGPYLYSLSSVTFFLLDNPNTFFSHTNYIDIYTLFISLPLFFIYFIFTIYKKSSISFNDATLFSFFFIFLCAILILFRKILLVMVVQGGLS